MPSFGRSIRDQWLLDPEIVYLNHGTVGAPPRVVLDAQDRIRLEIEARPSQYLLRELTAIRVGRSPVAVPRMRSAAARVAEFVGVAADDLVFVDNTTTGVNAILRSFPFAPGDEIVVTNIGYGAVNNTAAYVARTRGIALRTVTVPVPIAGDQVVVDAVCGALGPQTRVAVVDHISSDTGIVLPIAQIAQACRANDTRLLVDGAHAPGSVALDIDAIGADWYVGNLHKWAMSPRSSGILWCRPDLQADLHAPVISWGLDQGMATEFDLVGTRDPSPHLAAPAALDWLAEVGVADLMRHNHDLAWIGGNALAEAWGTAVVCPEAMVASMVTVPLPSRLGGGRDAVARVRDALLFDHGVEVHVATLGAGLAVRIGAQIYNDRTDFDALAVAVSQL